MKKQQRQSFVYILSASLLLLAMLIQPAPTLAQPADEESNYIYEAAQAVPAMDEELMQFKLYLPTFTFN